MIQLILGIIIIFIMRSMLKELRAVKKLLSEQNIRLSESMAKEEINEENDVCPDCGAILELESYVCPNCGAEFEDE